MGAPPRSTKAQAALHDTFEAITPGVSQGLAFTGASAQSTAVGETTTLVRLFATEDCFVKVGANPTAVANTSMFIASGIYEYIGIKPGEKIAAIRLTTSGTLYITEAF